MSQANIRLACLIVAGLAVLQSCDKPSTPFDIETHRKEIEEWRQRRLVRLTAEDGWLTLCGLWWLHQGENTSGSDSSNEVILPAGKAPPRVGSFFLDGNSVRFVAASAGFTHQDTAVTDIILQSDETDSPTILKHGTLRLHVISRGGKLAVRVKDSDNPARLNFKGLEYFPIDPKWRVQADFISYVPARHLSIPTMANTLEEYTAPGKLTFAFGSSVYELDALIEQGSEDKLFIMFGDETNGAETYGAGRQLYADWPDSNGKVVVDFNKAYNWPCVFTEYATCPLVPKQNMLPVRVEAGEKMYGSHE